MGSVVVVVLVVVAAAGEGIGVGASGWGLKERATNWLRRRSLDGILAPGGRGLRLGRRG